MLVTAIPPSLSNAPAKLGDETASMAPPRTGVDRVMPSTEKSVLVSSGLIVSEPGAIATSSNPYTRRSSLRCRTPIARKPPAIVSFMYGPAWAGVLDVDYLGPATLSLSGSSEEMGAPCFAGLKCAPESRPSCPVGQGTDARPAGAGARL